MIRKTRKRILVEAEGESEQSFIKFLQQLADTLELPVFLDCNVLDGGGYKTMLHRAISDRLRKEKSKGKAKKSILIVDRDRANNNDDGWSVEQLQKNAAEKGFIVCFQNPNLEGLLLRMLPGNERLQPNARTAQKDLTKIWKNYQKPADAQTLKSRYTLADLRRVANVDDDLKTLLELIGLI